MPINHPAGPYQVRRKTRRRFLIYRPGRRAGRSVDILAALRGLSLSPSKICQPLPREDMLDDHLVISHHYPKDAYRCELCPRAYSYRPSLLRHRAIVHGELRRFPCENCPKCTEKSAHLLLPLSSVAVW
uniref:C2H2-type domain-containing protein n=1 Tax=Anopheles melas TaxID=34690 RepID=A0A182TT79_9DIPT